MMVSIRVGLAVEPEFIWTRSTTENSSEGFVGMPWGPLEERTLVM